MIPDYGYKTKYATELVLGMHVVGEGRIENIQIWPNNYIRIKFESHQIDYSTGDLVLIRE